MSRERELGLIGFYDRTLAETLTNTRLSEAKLRVIRRTLERLTEELEKERRWNREREAGRKNRDQEVQDLRIHLRDRDAHVKNLEAQLRPLLTQHEPQTEAML